MALTTDLMGVGFAAEQAKLVGQNSISAVTAAGTTTSDATVLKKAQNYVNMTATGSDGIRLPADAALNRPYIVYNGSGSTGKVYPPSSGTLNGGSADGALSLTTLKVAMFIRYSSTGWNYIVTG